MAAAAKPAKPKETDETGNPPKPPRNPFRREPKSLPPRIRYLVFPIGEKGKPFKRPTPELRGAGGRDWGKTGQSTTPRPLERRVGPRAGTTLRPQTSQKRKRAAQPEPRTKAERGGGRPFDRLRTGLHHARLKYWWAGTNRQTTNDNNSRKTPRGANGCFTFRTAQPTIAVDPAARRAPALSSLTPNALAKGRGRTELGGNRPKRNPASP